MERILTLLSVTSILCVLVMLIPTIFQSRKEIFWLIRHDQCISALFFHESLKRRSLGCDVSRGAEKGDFLNSDVELFDELVIEVIRV